jgi:hypothetical protein
MVPVLDIGVGARACAMSGAFIAGADDASAVFWNPAGLSGVRTVEIGLTYDMWFMESFYSHMLIAVPAGPGTIAGDVIYVNGGSFPDWDLSGNPTGTSTQVMSIGGLLSYGMNIAGGFSAGITGKYIRETAGSVSNAGLGADVGLLFETGMWRIGLNARNLGTAGSYSMPMSINGGVRITPLKSTQHILSFELDGKYLLKDAPSVSAGAEYNFGKSLSVRTGYSYRIGEDSLSGLAGFAAGIGLSANGIRLDYAFVPYGDLGTSHRATLTYAFGPSSPYAAAARKTHGEEANKADVNMTVKQAEEFEKKGDLAKAAQKYRDAVLKDQDDAELWKKLGMVYYKDRKKENAVKAFEKYLKLNPGDSKFRAWLDKYSK